MMIGKALFAQLTGDATVAGLVADRVYPQTVAETARAYPCIVYDGGDAKVDETYGGYLAGNLAFQDVTVSCQATSYAGMDALATAAFKALSDGSGTWGGIKVQGCFYEGETEPPPMSISGIGSDALIYERELSFHLAFNLP